MQTFGVSVLIHMNAIFKYLQFLVQKLQVRHRGCSRVILFQEFCKRNLLKKFLRTVSFAAGDVRCRADRFRAFFMSLNMSDRRHATQHHITCRSGRLLGIDINLI